MKNSTIKRVVILAVLLVVGLFNGTQTQVSAQTPGRVDSSGYSVGVLDRMRMDAVDAEHIDGEFINQFLDQYPNSRLRGHGNTIKRLADKYGLNIAAYMGQIAKETTFGSATCGGEYNFGCFMWADWMGVGKVGPSTGHTQYDRDWANPGSVEQGIEIQMQLVRDGYVNKGLAYYPVYLERYSPAFENDHSSFESLMYGVFRAFGQNPNEERTKVPGGLADNIVLDTPLLTVERGTVITNDTLLDLYTHEDVESVELLQDVDTSEAGFSEFRVYLGFTDATARRETVNLEVTAKDIEIKVIDMDTGELLVTEIKKEDEALKLDITGLLADEGEYQVTTDAKDVLDRLGAVESQYIQGISDVFTTNETGVSQPQNKQTTQIVKGVDGLYVEVKESKGDTIVYVGKAVSPNNAVDNWIASVRK